MNLTNGMRVAGDYDRAWQDGASSGKAFRDFIDRRISVKAD